MCEDEILTTFYNQTILPLEKQSNDAALMHDKRNVGSVPTWQVGASNSMDFILGGALRLSGLEFHGETLGLAFILYMAVAVYAPLLKEFSRVYSDFLPWMKTNDLTYMVGYRNEWCSCTISFLEALLLGNIS